MKNIFYFLLLAAALAMQMALGDLIAIGGVKPDLPLIAICAISLLEGRAVGTVWALGLGLTEDFSGGGLLGAGALSRSVIAFLAGSLLHFRSVQNAFTASLVVGVLSLINNLTIFLVHLQPSGHLLRGIVFEIVFPSLYTIFLSVLIFAVVPETVWERIYKTESLIF
jgi:rod shape-determining protein MreD